MKYKWLNNKKNTSLILFFNGWGMDEAIISHLDYANYDVIMFYDYNDLETDFDFNLCSDYKECYVVSWSMGVMIATNFVNQLNITSSTAINGTLKPIDENFGIHPKIYDLTIKGFNENGRKRFLKTIFDLSCEIEISRDIENQKQELIAIKNYQAKNFIYSRVILSDNDKIIPTKSQVAYWGMEPNISSAHCPFNLFNKWEELL